MDILSKFKQNFLFECPLSRVIFLKKNAGAMSKIYCLISWSPIYTLLILVLASLKMANTSYAVIYNSIESGYAWRTLNIKVKESNRRPFNLGLDWILIHATSVM